MPVRIGELLLKEKRITPEQLQEALNYQKTNGGKLGFNLVKLGFVKDEEITALLSKQYGVPSINLDAVRDRPGGHQADSRRDRAASIRSSRSAASGATLTIAMTDPTNVFAMDDIKFMTGYNVEPVVASETAVIDAIERVLRRAGGARHARGQARRPAAATRARAASVARHGRPRRSRNADARSSTTTSRCSRSCEEIERRGAGEAGRGSAGHPAGERRADVGDSEGRERHPHRAVREGIPRPLPHRRHPLQHHGAADEVPRRDHLAHQDHGEARHRREAAAAGRPHQDPLRRQRRDRRRSTSASRACRRCSARRSSCVCSTRTS